MEAMNSRYSSHLGAYTRQIAQFYAEDASEEIMEFAQDTASNKIIFSRQNVRVVGARTVAISFDNEEITVREALLYAGLIQKMD